MLLNILECTGKSPTIKNYLAQNVNSAELENSGLKEASRVQIMKRYGFKSRNLAFLLRGVKNHSIWRGIGVMRSEF